MSDINNKNGRREFLKVGGVGLLGAAFGAGLLGKAPLARAQAGENVKPTDPTAQALGYYEDAKKTDVKKFPKRAGAEGAKQFCYNCQFYQNKAGDPKASKSAPCTIFANKNVMSHAWCNSWTQNPAVKS